MKELAHAQFAQSMNMLAKPPIADTLRIFPRQIARQAMARHRARLALGLRCDGGRYDLNLQFKSLISLNRHFKSQKSHA
jgi:hypothetical protein